jgi:hypothetical protein
MKAEIISTKLNNSELQLMRTRAKSSLSNFSKVLKSVDLKNKSERKETSIF